MANVNIGLGGTNYAKNDLRGGGEKRTDSGVEIVDVYSCSYANRVAVIAAIGINYGDGHSVETDSKLREINVIRIDPFYCELHYSYMPNNPGGATLQPVGTVTMEADANPLRIPIGQNANASGTNYDADKKVGVGDWDGITHYLSPQPIYIRSEVLNAFTFSEANIIDTVGKIDDSPEDMTTPTAGKWLVVGFGVRQTGDKFTKRKKWQYDAAGWNTDIYTTVL